MVPFKLVRTFLVLGILQLAFAEQDANADPDDDLETDTMIREILGVRPKDVILVNEQAESSPSFPAKTQRISSLLMRDETPAKQNLAVAEKGREESFRNQMLIQQELSLAQTKLNELDSLIQSSGVAIKSRIESIKRKVDMLTSAF